MSKALINALAMALAMEERYTLTEAVAFASEFVEGNADLFSAPATTVGSRAAVGARPAGPIPKCPNCHEPINDHMPNCARATGVDPRAVTAVHHLRVDGPPPQE